MYLILLLSIFINFIDCHYLAAESNYLKPKLERNNVVNKGVWIRKDNELPLPGNFLFRPSSADGESVMQTNFDLFSDDALQDSPFIASYITRTRRSPDHIRQRRPRKSMKMKLTKNSLEDAVTIKTKMMSNIQSASYLNEPLNRVAFLQNNFYKINNNTVPEEKIRIEMQNGSFNKQNGNNNVTNIIHSEDNISEQTKHILNNKNHPVVFPKRTKKYNYVPKDSQILNFVEEYNKNDSYAKTDKLDRNTFDVDQKIWSLNAPAPDTNIYSVITKDHEKPKAVTERGLLKVISMLTKTFKKIMNQHIEITNIHDKLMTVNDEFDRKLTAVTGKFEDFDSKYSDMIQFNDKLKTFEDKIITEEEQFKNRQKEIQNTFLEFESQQKKFLMQQKQFYAIQKLMLAQNEKINMKQNIIAQTQSEISHRQNNFARILKKAKQIYVGTKNKINFTGIDNMNNIYKVNNDKINNYKLNIDNTVIPLTTPSTTTTTERVKINLFSIPNKLKLGNQDELIIKDKDNQQIDDLVYKYYFNNTFIDTLMKSKILNNYATHMNSVDIARNAKIKRDEMKTTILLPVNNNINLQREKDTAPVREKRWINHFSRNKYKKANRHRKETTTIISDKYENKAEVKENLIKKDPFKAMASSFCNEIGQNNNLQELNWCVEKALRRLRMMDKKMSAPQPTTVMKEKPQKITKTSKQGQTPEVKELRSMESTTMNAVPPTIMLSSTAPVATPMSTPLYAVTGQVQQDTAFFPDNDALESNLKQYDLTPDTEGNVYYEGSWHISDFGRMLAPQDSDGTSDILPGLVDSNSKVDINPYAFDLQAKRRAHVQRLNEDILKRIQAGYIN